MNLYLITRTDEIGWDEMSACVVRAADELAALDFAASLARDEGPEVWSSTDVTVTTVGSAFMGDNTQALILQDVNNG